MATNVENVWTSSRSNSGKAQLTEALWLGCGSHGMKVCMALIGLKLRGWGLVVVVTYVETRSRSNSGKAQLTEAL